MRTWHGRSFPFSVPPVLWGARTRVALAASALVLLAGPAAGATLVVDDDGRGTTVACDDETPAFSTVGGAIAASVPGDTIRVCPGTYPETINFLGKTITVESTDGAAVTTLDAGRAGSVATFASGEGPGAVLRGFTLQNGRSPLTSPAFGDGGGIRIQSASPTITENVIADNQGCVGPGISIRFGSPSITRNSVLRNSQFGCSGGTGGGGIAIVGASSAQILDNVIADNLLTSADGGGIALFAAGTPMIRGNVIRGNTATGVSPCTRGGGISLVNVSDATITGNLITQNSAGCGGGVAWLVPSGARGPVLLNNTVADNLGTQGSAVFADGFDVRTELVNNILVASPGQTAVYCGSFNDLNPPLFRFNDVWSPSGAAYGGICSDQTGVDGNISADPLFVSPGSGVNYHLALPSPAVDAGDSAAPGLPASDIDGQPRILDGNGDGVAYVDMGADELAPPPVLIVPGTIIANATSPSGAPVSYTVSVSDPVDPHLSLVCAPASGSIFPIGSTTVACTAIDSAGNSATASFQIVVRGAAEQISDLIALVGSLDIDASLTRLLTSALEKALAAVEAGDTPAACTHLDDFILRVQRQTGRKLTPTQAGQLVAGATQVKAVLACP
jgi:nitrous oxidase accessory protein NosD